MTQEAGAEAPPVRYVVVDDEPVYRHNTPTTSSTGPLEKVGAYPDLESFLALHRSTVDVIVLDLCLDRRTRDPDVLQGVRAVHMLTSELGHRVVVHTADERAEPVARAVAAGATAYVSKYLGDDLPDVIGEVGRHGAIQTPALQAALQELSHRVLDIRLSATLEQTLDLLEHGLSDAQIAAARNISVRTVEDHKHKILVEFGEHMERASLGFADLRRELGTGRGDLVNDLPGGRPARGVLARSWPWHNRSGRRGRSA